MLQKYMTETLLKFNAKKCYKNVTKMLQKMLQKYLHKKLKYVYIIW